MRRGKPKKTRSRGNPPEELSMERWKTKNRENNRKQDERGESVEKRGGEFRGEEKSKTEELRTQAI